MADIASTLRGWNSTAGSNQPTDSTTIGAGLDDNLRQLQAVVRQFLASKGTDTASAGIDLSTADGYYINVTGTTAITSLGTEGSGISYWLNFNGALTLTYNATSMILPGKQDIKTAAGDMACVFSLGSGNWICTQYLRADGTATPAVRTDVASAGTVDLQTAGAQYQRITGTTGITAITLTNGHARQVVFGGALTLTNSASLILPGGVDITTAAGDTAIFVGEASSIVRCLHFQRASLTPRQNPTVQVYTSTSTWVKPSGLAYAVVEVQAAGGGGANATFTTTTAAGGGGGAGGYAKKMYLASSLAASVVATIGAAGAANSSAAAAVFSAVSCNGGAGATAAVDNATFGAVGGIATGGDINITGGAGTYGVGSLGGLGGVSFHGGPAQQVIADTNGNAGAAKGSGGGGAATAGGAKTGGSGAGGQIVVWEFY